MYMLSYLERNIVYYFLLKRVKQLSYFRGDDSYLKVAII